MYKKRERENETEKTIRTNCGFNYFSALIMRETQHEKRTKRNEKKKEQRRDLFGMRGKRKRHSLVEQDEEDTFHAWIFVRRFRFFLNFPFDLVFGSRVHSMTRLSIDNAQFPFDLQMIITLFGA